MGIVRNHKQKIELLDHEYATLLRLVKIDSKIFLHFRLSPIFLKNYIGFNICSRFISTFRL